MKKIDNLEIRTNRSKTKYPILLVHGVGARDRKKNRYWGRIPRILSESGAVVFFGNTGAWERTPKNADILIKSIEDILLKTGAEKVNIIAHSKGGLDSRYAISSLGLGEKVSSLTTIATPHHGSKTLNAYCFLPRIFRRFIAIFVDLWYRVIGDKKPDFYRVTRELSQKYMDSIFNPANPDIETVYYQSYAVIMKRFYSDIFRTIPYLVVKLFEGPNDGFVTPSSAKWTNFKGILQSAGSRGISHNDSVDRRKRSFSKNTVEGKHSDIREFYLCLVEELKNKGF